MQAAGDPLELLRGGCGVLGEVGLLRPLLARLEAAAGVLALAAAAGGGGGDGGGWGWGWGCLKHAGHLLLKVLKVLKVPQVPYQALPVLLRHGHELLNVWEDVLESHEE